MPIEIRRFGVGNRRPDGPPGTVGVTAQIIHADGLGLIAELAFGRGARIEPHINPNTSWFVVIEGGGWVGVDRRAHPGRRRRGRPVAGRRARRGVDRALRDAGDHGRVRGRRRRGHRRLPGEPRGRRDRTPRPPSRVARASSQERPARATGRPGGRRTGLTTDSPGRSAPDATTGGPTSPPTRPSNLPRRAQPVTPPCGRARRAGRGNRGPGRWRGSSSASSSTTRTISCTSRSPVHSLPRRTSAVVATSRSSWKPGSVEASRGARSARADVPPELLGRTALRIGPAQPDLGQPVALAHAVAQPDGVQDRDLVAGPDGAGVDGVVGEVAVRHRPVLVAELAVRGDRLGVELDLRLGVEGDRLEGPGQVLGEQPAGLVLAVDVGVEAVAVVGQLLEQGVVVVAHADPDRDELDARRRVLADARQDALGIGQADVGDAVRGQHDPVDAVLGERLAGQPVAQPQAGLEVRRAARVELVDGLADGPRVVGGRSAGARPGRRRRR